MLSTLVKPSVDASKRLGFIQPMLLTLVDAPPSGDGWLHEIKHDGEPHPDRSRKWLRARLHRNGHDWTSHYRRPVERAAQLPCWSAVLDGEMIVQDDRGISDFPALRRAIHQQPHRIVFYAFDLLSLNGEDLRGIPLLERKVQLKKLLGDTDPVCPIQFSEAIEGDGAAVSPRPSGLGSKGSSLRRRRAGIAAAAQPHG